jgi:hypothetical protein
LEWKARSAVVGEEADLQRKARPLRKGMRASRETPKNKSNDTIKKSYTWQLFSFFDSVFVLRDQLNIIFWSLGAHADAVLDLRYT